MKDKVYDFLPAHLKNGELENIFNSTLDRVFSKGEVEKIRSFVGRKEKGIYSRNNSYLEYPFLDTDRNNYGLEPVYSNTNIRDNVFYDDLLNLIYNKGGLINDHRRLFTNNYKTINLPIDSDKFCNWAMYYWVYPDFDITISGSNLIHYITIDKNQTNWWGKNNSWYHFEDIKGLLTSENKHLVKQATRPIIEFDSRLELSATSFNKPLSDLDFEEPTFAVYNSNGDTQADVKIFSYVSGTASDYPYDADLMLYPKMIAGDYYSEYSFVMDLSEDMAARLDGNDFKIYTQSNFPYRNVRQEKPEGLVTHIKLDYEPSSINDIDVYVNGIRQNQNYSYDDGVITLDDSTTEYVYVDYSTLYPVTEKTQYSYQLVNPSVEYNPDNLSHVNVEFAYSTIFDHLIRIIETTAGLEGQAISNNNFRDLVGSDKVKYNDQGSIMIKSDVDVSLAYFSITRDDYNPFVAVETLSSAYNSFKNKLVSTIQEILKSVDQGNKTDTEILEEALSKIAINKSTVYKVYEGIGMLDYGVKNNHYEELQVSNVVGSLEQFMPSFTNPVVNDSDIAIYVNGVIQIYGIDYSISSTGGEILFSSFVPTINDVILVRHYTNREDLRVPPSAVKLGIAPSFVPSYSTDSEFSEPVEFIVGHDGSKTPRWNDRTDDILFEYEVRVYNKLQVRTTNIDYMNFGVYSAANTEYTYAEKNHIAYPFFKKWMVKNEISNMYNDTFNPNDWKTWNYSALNSELPGNWRGIYTYLYGTENVLVEPWRALKLSQKPDNFDSLYGTNYTSPSFWAILIADNNLDIPVPVYTNGDLKTIDDLIYEGGITSQIIETLRSDWYFGDCSPIEMAWKRSSEYPFITFIEMMLQKPFNTMSDYKDQISYIVSIYTKILGINFNSVSREKNNYSFKLGSKLAGFVNNFVLLSENQSLVDSKYTEIPTDNYDLFIHASVPNKTENFSAITIEKVSLDKVYPNYDILNTTEYLVGDIVINPSDGKYYKRKANGQTSKEQSQSVSFDYAAWILVSQPKIKQFGFRIHGYIDLHPEFPAYEWDFGSGKKVYETVGDKMSIANWKQNTFYRQNDYVLYNQVPYVCLETHTSGTTFGDSLTKWKAVGVWPRVNKTYANGYNKVNPNLIKTYKYGEVLSSVDDVVHLLVGYQEYLVSRGWKFVDIFENSSPIDFESLIPQFLDWSAENHSVGEYISLTPIKENGEFSAPHGVAKVGKDTFKNFYRVVDAGGNKISENDINFYSTGNTLSWESSIPVYGMMIDVTDIEHAFVVDRVDSYNDIIYDPLNHNRNLRMMVDCNRATGWDGTMTTEGYIVYGNKMIPNFETVIDEIQNYRDTILDQSLESINLLKASQIGFFPREYFNRMGIERESQLEFYKGFLAGKGTKGSINRLVNLESNITDIENSDVWAFKVSEYGSNNSRRKESTVVNISDLKKSPYVVTYENMQYPMETTTAISSVPIKTSGYVNSTDVTHVVMNSTQLGSLDVSKIYEGDIAWVQFDDDREWDTRRLSEIAEIVYLGETPDAQLYIALTNEISTDSEVFLRIVSSGIQPQIQGYYYPVFESTQTYNGMTVYLYLIFDMNYEAVIVEIDTSTSNSVYVPTQTIPYVEANGSVANPAIVDGDTIVINGISYTYDESGIGTNRVQIYGSEYAVNPFVQSGERIRISVFDSLGQLVNNNTTVTFTGTVAQTATDLVSEIGDQISIDGTTLTIAASLDSQIVIISDKTETAQVPVGSTITVDGDVVATFENVVAIGTNINPTLASTKALSVNGTVITFTVPTGTITGTNSSETFTNVSTPVASVQLTSSMTNYLPGNITVDNGVAAPYVLTTADYVYNSNTKVITFDTPILDGQVADVATETQTIVVDGIETSYTLTGPFNTADRIIVTDYVEGTDYTISGSNIVFTTAPTVDVIVTYETDVMVDQDGTVSLTVQLVAQPVAQVLDIDDIVSIINASSAPVVASKTISNALQISYSGPILTMNGSVLIDFGMSTTSSYRKTAYEGVVSQIDAQPNLVSYLNADEKIVISTTQDSITLGGTALIHIGIDDGQYNAVASPDRNSVVSQINALSIPNIQASLTTNGIQIYKNNHLLTITEITSGAMNRLGFASATVTVNSALLIADQINSQAFGDDSSVGLASVENNRIKIISPQKSITISSLNGNALDSIGIPTGTYLATTSVLSPSVAFKDQINAVADDVVVSISSDGRMIFVGSNNVISFVGTSQALLDKIGLYKEYSSITSSNDFKVMDWKSVRYTPNYNGTSFSQFYDNLGLNGTSYIWADDYDGNGWVVLNRSEDGTLIVTQRQAPRVNVENINRLIITDDQTNHRIYSLYDPLNLKFPGDVGAKLSYVSWQDPAQYEFDITMDKWAENHIGEMWWDTTSARYYRYNDYGDQNGNIVLDFAGKYWGKLVPSSEVKVYRWSSSTVLPDDVTKYNKVVYIDPYTNKNTEKYYFWTSESIDQEENDLTPSDIKMMIENRSLVDNFFPVSSNTILVSNSKQVLRGDRVRFNLDYYADSSRNETHSDWHLVSEKDSRPIPDDLCQEFIDSIAGAIVIESLSSTIVAEEIDNIGNIVISGIDFLNYCDFTNSVVTVNSKIVPVSSLDYTGDTLTINYSYAAMIGDVVRVYQLSSDFNNWFKNLSEARRNFSYIVNEYMKRKFISGFAYNWDEYVYNYENSIISLDYWSLNEKYDSIPYYEYLSKTKTFDMNGLYASGIQSFRVSTDVDEYYFPVDGHLRMVHRTNSSMRVSYENFITPALYSEYYINGISVQTIEFMNMMKAYAEPEFMKSLFIEMVKYMLTEKTYPDFVFKTSYFDLMMKNNGLKQSAIYLRDYYEDMIDYVNDTKPYHAKIRNVTNHFDIQEDVGSSVTEINNMNIRLKFGNTDYYTIVVDEAFDADPIIYDIDKKFNPSSDELSISVFINGVEIRDQYYTIENGNLVFNTNGDILDGSTTGAISVEVGDRIMVVKNISRYALRKVDGNNAINTENSYDGGTLIQTVNSYTNNGYGIDTGYINSKSRDILVLSQTDYTDQTRTTLSGKKFYVYDQFGRGYIVEVDQIGTISQFDGASVVVNQQSYFKSAKGDTKRLSILDNGSELEFFLYDKKDGTELRISDRGIYTGKMANFSNGDTIYSVKSVSEI